MKKEPSEAMPTALDALLHAGTIVSHPHMLSVKDIAAGAREHARQFQVLAGVGDDLSELASTQTAVDPVNPLQQSDRQEAEERAETTRMSLDLTSEMKATVDELARRAGTTRAELLRRAIALMKTVKEAERAGLSPGLIDQEGNVKARLVGV
jgi:predicted transcriptional regulator